jgi:hypothetical protein
MPCEWNLVQRPRVLRELFRRRDEVANRLVSRSHRQGHVDLVNGEEAQVSVIGKFPEKHRLMINREPAPILSL